MEYLEGTPAKHGNQVAGSGKKRVDYKEVLSPEDFAVFVRLREWRKKTAGIEAVPLYTVFTNEQIAEMAKERPRTLAGLGQIQGVGEARIKKYGTDVLAVIDQKEPDAVTGGP